MLIESKILRHKIEILLSYWKRKKDTLQKQYNKELNDEYTEEIIESPKDLLMVNSYIHAYESIFVLLDKIQESKKN